MKKYTRLLAALLTLAMMLSLMTACGGTADPSAAPESSDASAAQVSDAEDTEEAEEAPEVDEAESEEEPSSGEAEEPEEEIPQGPVAGDKDFDWSVFEPLSEEPVTLTMFYTQPPPLAAIMDSPNDMSLLYQKFEEITNVHIDFQMVNMMDASTTFTLMIAGGDYCDIVNDTLNYYDTADQAYEDGIAVDLMEYPDSVPNFMALMEKYPQIRTDLETLEGHILNMPRIDMPIGQAAENGLLIRQDWLDDLGLDMPNSYDEMHDVLAAFKSAYNVTDPYVMPYQVLSPWGLMSAGYGIPAVADANNFYVDLETDKVELATTSDAYYDYLCMFRDWYQEGLINPNFVSQASNIPDESIISTEQTGIWFSDLSYIKTYQELLASINPNSELALMGDPGIDDQRSGYMEKQFTVAGKGGFSVSEQCDDVALALSWCDMWYNPDLTQFINYGYEGETFEYDENGKPVLGGIIVNNDLGLPSLKMANGVYLCTSGGFIYDLHKYDLEFTNLQLEAYTKWIITADDPSTVVTADFPGGAKLTADEADAVTTAMGDINTHVGEMALKFVTGAVELTPESYASYVTDIEGMRLREALDAMQEAYDRYLSNQ